jgi:hypothetical protein
MGNWSMGNWQLGLGLGLTMMLTACGLPNPDSAPTSDTVSAPTETAAPEAPPAAETQNAPENAAEAPSAVGNTTSAEDAAPWDRVVVPGERVGPITASTTHEYLVECLGEAALQYEEIKIGEGVTTVGPVVDLGPEAGLTVVWVDDSRQQVAEVREFGAAWTTPEGLGPGSSLADMQAVLGTFEFYGFNWDYGGTVLFDGTPLAEYQGLLFLRLQPLNREAPELNSFIGDGAFSSEDPALAPLELVVDTMVVRLEN